MVVDLSITSAEAAPALIASAVTPLALWLLGEPGPAVLFLVLPARLWLMHRANIARLMAGTEGKIGAKA